MEYLSSRTNITEQLKSTAHHGGFYAHLVLQNGVSQLCVA